MNIYLFFQEVINFDYYINSEGEKEWYNIVNHFHLDFIRNQRRVVELHPEINNWVPINNSEDIDYFFDDSELFEQYQPEEVDKIKEKLKSTLKRLIRARERGNLIFE